jgi:hypothetical protein
VRIQLLEDENDVLQDQLAEADENLELSERAEDDLRDQLAVADVEAQRLQNELRIKTREVATLKVGKAMNDACKPLIMNRPRSIP